MTIKFGPAGLGGVKDAISNLKIYHKLGLKACEILFGKGIYLKKKQDALEIGRAAKKFGIKLSIHAPYYINLNSKDKEIIKKSKQRILKCCEIGTYLGAYRIVFHPGYYNIKGTKFPLIKTHSLKSRDGLLKSVAVQQIRPPLKFEVMLDIKKQEAYENIKNAILEMQKEIKLKKYTPKLAPETTGKINVFGSIDEISQLVKDTGCSFCIDFAHILARYKNYKFKEVLEKFQKHKDLHIHFSGIEYNGKGEKRHIKTPEKDLKKLVSALPKRKNITIINESPNPVKDSILGLGIYEK